MGKIIYINGNLVINTPYFKCKESGAFYTSPPPRFDKVWQPNKKDSIFEINDNNPQSIFNEYYAKGSLSTPYTGAEFLYKTYEDVYKDYESRINDIKSIIYINTESNKQKEILFRLLYLSIIASLETFVSDIIITKITESEESFEEYYERFIQNTKKNKLENLLDKGLIGKREQEIISHAQFMTYSDIDKIIDSLKYILSVNIIDKNDKITNHIYNRHIIAHKNGRTKDGKYLTFNERDLENLIMDTNEFVKHIMTAIKS